MHNSFSIAIHGGAGTLDPKKITKEQTKEYKLELKIATEKGFNILSKGGSAIEAVEASVIYLENCPLFNAGRGAVFTHNGKNELDASIMDGFTGSAGAVAGITLVKNPIKLARKVKDNSEHVLLSGVGAMEFAFEMGVQFETENYFHTDFRKAQLNDALVTGKVYLDHSLPKPMGTVGAVAKDKNGKLAAATSTGGMTNKKYGRLGDTPIIGAGTWADENCCVSCTGHGEFFIRNVVAYDVACLLKYKGLDLPSACDEVILKKLHEIGGEGGLIAINKNGEIHFSFNSSGMYRASMGDNSGSFVAIF